MSETDQKVKEILSVIKENQGKKVELDKQGKLFYINVTSFILESADKSHKHKKNKKEKKHKKDRENPISIPTLTIDRPSSSASTGKLPPKLPKPSIQSANRPASQNSSTPKLFEVTSTVPQKPKKPTFSTLETLKQKTDASKQSLTKKERSKSEFGKNQQRNDTLWVCPNCSVAYIEGNDDMIGCDGCDQWFHFQCVGMLRPPNEKDDWFCKKCVDAKRKKSKGKKK